MVVTHQSGAVVSCYFDTHGGGGLRRLLLSPSRTSALRHVRPSYFRTTSSLGFLLRNLLPRWAFLAHFRGQPLDAFNGVAGWGSFSASTLTCVHNFSPFVEKKLAANGFTGCRMMASGMP